MRKDNKNTTTHKTLVNSVSSDINTKPKNKEITTAFHKSEEYISSNYQIRFNTIALDIESSMLDSEKWESCNENTLWVKMQKRGDKNRSKWIKGYSKK